MKLEVHTFDPELIYVLMGKGPFPKAVTWSSAGTPT